MTGGRFIKKQQLIPQVARNNFNGTDTYGSGIFTLKIFNSNQTTNTNPAMMEKIVKISPRYQSSCGL